MIDAGWSRTAEDIVLDERDLLELPYPDLDNLRHAINSGILAASGIEVWRETGYRERLRFLCPGQVPCVTTLP